MNMLHQGDILLIPLNIDADSVTSKRRVGKTEQGYILAQSEQHGHAHLVKDGSADLFEIDNSVELSDLCDQVGLDFNQLIDQANALVAQNNSPNPRLLVVYEQTGLYHRNLASQTPTTDHDTLPLEPGAYLVVPQFQYIQKGFSRVID